MYLMLVFLVAVGTVVLGITKKVILRKRILEKAQEENFRRRWFG